MEEKGYAVTVKADTRGRKNYQRTFSIHLIGSEIITQEISNAIQKQFALLSEFNTPKRLYLTDAAVLEILPMLPLASELLQREQNGEIVNTQKTDLVNTFEPEEPKESTNRDASFQDAILPVRRSKQQAIADNKKAIEILEAKDFDTKVLTLEERALLENYAGVGGQYEDGNQQHNIDALTQFYTPDFVGERLYKIASQMGFPADGHVLEPSCGVGRLIKHAPDYRNVTAFEISDIPYRMAKKLYPQAEIHNLFFEQAFLKTPRYTDVIRGASPTWLQGYPFDLVIGNPPYGKHKNKYQPYFSFPKFPQIEFFFLYYCAKLLKPGGLLMFVTASNFIRTGLSYQPSKEKALELLKFERAYRMPNEFMELTEVGADILIFRKK